MYKSLAFHLEISLYRYFKTKWMSFWKVCWLKLWFGLIFCLVTFIIHAFNRCKATLCKDIHSFAWRARERAREHSEKGGGVIDIGTGVRPYSLSLLQATEDMTSCQRTRSSQPLNSLTDCVWPFCSVRGSEGRVVSAAVCTIITKSLHRYR